MIKLFVVTRETQHMSVMFINITLKQLLYTTCDFAEMISQ